MEIRPFLLERFFATHEFATPHLLCSSDCESLSVRELLDMEPGAEERLRELWLGYTRATGAPGLRREIASLYRDIDEEQVLVHSGAEEAIFCVVHALLRPGDHVIVHYPCYQSLFEIASSIGCEVTPWVTMAEEGWRLDLDFLRNSLQDNTRLVVVNFPHNPTGHIMSPEAFLELAALSRSHGFILFSDEVYRFLEYGSHPGLPPLCDIDDRGLSLGVMSKSFGLGGLRIGWIATRNRPLLEKTLTIKDYTTYSNSAPSELLAEIALHHRDVILARNLTLIGNNLRLLDEFFASREGFLHWSPPDGGPIAFPSLSHSQFGDARSFCDALLAWTGVLLLPGDLYDPAYGNHVRIGFGRKNFPQCLELLEQYLDDTSK